MKKLIGLVSVLALLGMGNVSAAVINYAISSVGSESCVFNMVSVSCPMDTMDAMKKSHTFYNTDTHTLTMDMFGLGNVKHVEMTIPFINNAADDAGNCFTTDGMSEPMSYCQNPLNNSVSMFANASFDPHTQLIAISQLALLLHASEVGVGKMTVVNSVLAPIQ